MSDYDSELSISVLAEMLKVAKEELQVKTHKNFTKFSSI